MRLGILGGSFDPVHYGHLLLAETCREACRLDEVWFVPAAISPHKLRQQSVDAQHRLRMLHLAVDGTEAFRINECEIERGGISFTVDTLDHIHDQAPAAELYFLLGADALADLPKWHQPERICQLAVPVVVCRPDTPPPNYGSLASFVDDERLERIRSHQVDMPLIQLSSTDIRHRVASGKSIRFRLPRAVETYIREHGLYV